MGIRMFGEEIIDNYQCALDPGCEVMDIRDPLQMIISTKNITIVKYNPKEIINNHSKNYLKDHHLQGIKKIVELVIDNYQCAFNPGWEVLDENNPIQVNISTNKRIIGKQDSHDFIINHQYSTFKDHNFLGKISFVELIIDNCQCVFDQSVRYRTKRTLSKLIYQLIKQEQVNKIYRN